MRGLLMAIIALIMVLLSAKTAYNASVEAHLARGAYDSARGQLEAALRMHRKYYKFDPQFICRERAGERAK